MKMKLYEFGPTRSIRVRWTLQELGADFESIRVNLLAGEHAVKRLTSSSDLLPANLPLVHSSVVAANS
jgi:glutathione S-transferase